MDRKRRAIPLLLAASAVLTSPALLAASPPNITSDINWVDSGGEYDSENRIYDAEFGGVGDIEIAFNHARREEEKQLGLTPGTLGDLDLPPQGKWDAMSDDAKALFLVNAERTARAGMLPGVLGLPLAGIEANINGISQAYGDILHDYDLRGHLHDGPPSYRIERDPVIGSKHLADINYPNDPSQRDHTAEAPALWEPTHSDGTHHNFGDGASCHEFLSRSENLAYYASTAPIPMPIERSIYSFIYDDASSHWGHREAILLQDNGLGYEDKAPGFTGYANNHGSTASEGFMGFYLRESNKDDDPNNTYQPFGSGFKYGTVVVMNFFDPVADDVGGCNYTITKRNEDLPRGDGDIGLMAFDDVVRTKPGASVVISPTDNDAGARQGSSIEVTRQPNNGSIEKLTPDTLRYTPASGFIGNDALAYRVTTPQGKSSSASITVQVSEAASNEAQSNNASRQASTTTTTAPASTQAATPDDDAKTPATGSSNLYWLLTLGLLFFVRDRQLLVRISIR